MTDPQKPAMPLSDRPEVTGPDPAATSAAVVVGLVWLAHTTAIDRLDVTKLAVALVAAALATIGVAWRARLGRAATPASRSPSGPPASGRPAVPPASVPPPGSPAFVPPPGPPASGRLLDRGPLARELPPSSPAPVLAIAGICLLLATIAFPALVQARVEGWSPWIAAALLLGLVRTSPSRRPGTPLIVFAVFLALLGLAQALGLRWFIGDLAGFRGRPVMGTLGNPDLYGVCLAGALPFAVVRARRWPFAMAATAILAAVLASGSRTAWVMLLPSAVLAARSLGWRPFLGTTAAAVALATLVALASPRLDLQSRLTDLVDPAGTAAGRLYLWRVHARLLLDAGPLGGGPQAFQRQWPWAQADYLAHHPADADFHSDLRHAHADPIELATDYGWLGLGIAVWWFVRLLRARPSAPADETAAARTSLLALGLGGLALPVLFQAPSLALAAVAAGVVAAPPRSRAGPAMRAAVLVAVLLALWWTGQRFVSELLRNEGMRAELAGRLEVARERYTSAAAVDPANPLAQWLLAGSLLPVDPAAASTGARLAAHELPIAPLFALWAVAAEAAGDTPAAAQARDAAIRLGARFR